MKQYQELLQTILETGTRQKNRTGIDTFMIPSYMLRFDLREGFPAVTTKKLAFKSVVGELLGFLRGCNTVKEFNDLGCKVWDANANAPAWEPYSNFPGDLQKIYGYQWRKWNCYDNWMDSVSCVKQNTFQGVNKPFHIDIDIEEPIYDTYADDLVGTIMPTKNHGNIKVLQRIRGKKNSSYKVQFLEGINSIVYVARPNIRRGQCDNPYAMTAADGNGCIGIIKKKHTYYNKAYILWANMMERCHGSDPLKIIFYKNQDIFVDSRWRCFQNFYEDIHSIVGFNKWINEPSKYDLDKDYHGCTFYGKKSTIFLPSNYNKYILPKSTGDLFIATNKQSGKKYEFTSARYFNTYSNTNGLVDRAFRDQNGETKKWKFEKISAPEGYAWRQKFYHDQIETLLHQIETNPTSRRLIVSAWRPDELNQMALPPCHYAFQVIIEQETKTMHLLWNQRSCDVFLGIPFNIASYATLLHILAKITGYNVGTLTGFLADAHIYEDHIDQVKEQLSRTPYELPQLMINPAITVGTRIEEIKPTDFALFDYKHHSAIKASMAV